MEKKSLLKTIFYNFGEIISGSFLIITTILVIVNVFLRFVMNTGLYWIEEVSTGAFVWAIFVGAAAGFKRHKHIGVDFLVQRLPEGIRKVVNIIVDITLIIINGYLTYLSIVYIRFSYLKPTPVLGISSAYISASLLFSFFLMTIYSVMFLVKTLTNKEKIIGGE